MKISTYDPRSMDTDALRDEIDALSTAVGKAIGQMGPGFDAAKITVINGDAAAKASWLRSANERLGEIKGEWSHRPRGENPWAPGGDNKPVTGGLGDLFVQSDAAWGGKGREIVVDNYGAAEFKADFTTSAGWAPQAVRSGVVALSAQRQPNILDILPVVGTSESSYVYMEETTFTDTNVVEKAEGAQFGEASLGLTERDVPIRKIPVFLPATDEQLADVPQAREYVTSRLGDMITRRLGGQIVNGNGEAPNISGFLDASLNTHARTTESILDAIHAGFEECRTVGYAEPDAIVMSPDVWSAIRTLTTSDGVFIMGSPTDSGPRVLFGVPVVIDAALAAGTALVGAFRSHSALIVRQGLEFKVSDSHSDYFGKGKLAIRATMRAALAVYRPKAFCSVTALVPSE